MYFTKKQLTGVLQNILTENNLATSFAQSTKILNQFLLNLEEIMMQNPKGLLFGNLGKFKIVSYKPRKGFNLHTKKAILIPSKQVVVFKSSKAFKRKLLERQNFSL